MGTFSSSVRCARLLAALVLLALLLHGDASAHRPPHDNEHPWNDAFWAHETDEVSASIAERVVAAGYTYGQARWWLSRRCPRRGMNGTLDRITRRCYARGLRSLEEMARPQPPPPPTPPPPPPQQEESPEDKARRRVIQILNTGGGPIYKYQWPVKIANPVIKSRLRRSPPLPPFLIYNGTTS